mgnify:CR=1 FL=1
MLRGAVDLAKGDLVSVDSDGLTGRDMGLSSGKVSLKDSWDRAGFWAVREGVRGDTVGKGYEDVCATLWSGVCLGAPAVTVLLEPIESAYDADGEEADAGSPGGDDGGDTRLSFTDSLGDTVSASGGRHF